ncbi:MAG: hypothetical protein R2777_07805 [Chitinophagales bacterium]
MATITLKYNPKNKLAKKTIDFILTLGIFEIKGEDKVAKDFIAELERRIEEDKFIEVNASDIWQSIK